MFEVLDAALTLLLLAMQVRLFEVIILLSILLSAIFTGLCMLHILDVPSKFEVDKKESISRHE